MVHSELKLEEKVGQLFMPAAFVNDTEEEIQRLEDLIRQHAIGAICFFHSRASAATNYEGKKEVLYNADSFHTLQGLVKRYQAAAKYPLLIAIDAEWGLAMRIENTPQYPYNLTLGALEDKQELIYEMGRNVARDCRAAGIHWNLAPCVDINNNANNPVIGYRSFGENKSAVAEKASAYIKGMQREGVLSSIKHFPGHGDTETDSHLGLPLIDKPKEALLANELYPFRKLIEEQVDSVMIGHLSVPALAGGKTESSSISKEIIKGFLRAELGYEGLVISDALNMHAVSKNYTVKGELEWLAFDAGNDVLCFAENVVEGIATIMEKATSSQIEDSFQRLWGLKTQALQSAAKHTMSPTKPKADSALNRKIAEGTLTLLVGTEEAIASFKKTDFCTMTIKRTAEEQSAQALVQQLQTMASEVANETNILLLLTPPEVKPTNAFGLLDEEIALINQLIQTKNVVLYLFGNPYALQLINYKQTRATVVAYQAFKEFQEVATEHFMGRLQAKGKLPVTLN